MKLPTGAYRGSLCANGLLSNHSTAIDDVSSTLSRSTQSTNSRSMSKCSYVSPKMTPRAFAVPPGTETLTMSPRVISEPSWYLMVRDETQRERDKPRQGVVANTLNLFRNGAVDFIVWLGLSRGSRSVIAGG